MTMQKLKQKTEGFTIIEVLIVLAIAGLIMLIVFLAVPALQRNARNNARNNDASRIASAATECLANRNGSTAACNNTTVQTLAGTLSQLTTVNNGGGGSLVAAGLTYGAVCNPDGSGLGGGGGAGTRSVAVQFLIETGGGGTLQRCVGS